MNVGYIRVSTTDQNTERQLDGIALDKVFTDTCSGSTVNRPQLRVALEVLRPGDTLWVHSVDRLSRSLVDLLGLMKDLNSRGIGVRFVKDGALHCDGTAASDLQLGILAVVAQFERARLLERQAEGIAKAKLRGAYKGGTSGRNKKAGNDDATIREAVESGLSYRKAAERLGVSLSTVQRAMKSA
ncbi:recombinase family protein [Pseudomonas sp. JUb96]|uniref:recombinase family protein n=1 Tax=Pseudomonas sp. JUb96 TaxID=2940539 RepID=UPI002225F007|nr:recombinase family protein [Pseudomonas sp. JUb96]MCW2267598.1 DNA invertase Pin-like site-specific DNA recombinase [Pseudomonas sp. JUb96]